MLTLESVFIHFWIAFTLSMLLDTAPSSPAVPSTVPACILTFTSYMLFQCLITSYIYYNLEELPLPPW